MECKPYESKLIEALQNASVDARANILETLHKKNRSFFKQEEPAVYEFLNHHLAEHFEIIMTEDFFDVFDHQTDQYLHVQGQLAQHSKLLAENTHSRWLDLQCLKVPEGDKKYAFQYAIQQAFKSKLFESCLDLKINAFQQKVQNKHFGADGSVFYAPTIVFQGLLHGLHVAHHLSKNVYNHVFIFEPNASFFVLSTYFLDYELIKKNCQRYYLSVGDVNYSSSIQWLMERRQCIPATWIRLLSAYDYPKKEQHCLELNALQNTKNDLFYPIDLELYANKSVVQYLKDNLPLLSRIPKALGACSICIIGSGPSLSFDLDWLRKNQNNTIIFIVPSVARLLKREGIRPDFQFNLNATHPGDIKTLDLFADVPLIAIYKTEKTYLDAVDTVLLCGAHGDTNIVEFKEPLLFNAASSAAFALKFALLCQPKEIYLLGCDCGYTQASESNVAGTYHESDLLTDEQKCLENLHHSKRKQFKTMSNIDNLTQVNSNTELMAVLRSLEEIISLAEEQATHVYNFSLTGAFIKGTTFAASSDFQRLTLPDKSQKMKTILSAFSPAEENKNWFRFEGKGSERLNIYKQKLDEKLSVSPKNWPSLSILLDTTSYEIFFELKSSEQDGRLGCYRALFETLLRMLFNELIQLTDFHAAQKNYQKGIDAFKKVISDIQWPKELKDI